ncbi:MAG: ComF family protein [Chloroflexota bacterium]
MFPRWCIGCGREGYFFCPSCIELLAPVMPPVCPRCGRPQGSARLCPGCRNWDAKIDGIRAPFRFEGVARDAVHQLKYNRLRILAPELAQLMTEHLAGYPVPGNVLVPVPLHPKRLRERGYNQSGLLARELGRRLKLPLNETCLVRQRDTSPQVGATLAERRANVAGAFRCRDFSLQGKGVILVDDVVTTGATLDACAAALKAAAVVSVWGLTFAREI